MESIQPHFTTDQLPMVLKAKQELARFQSSLLVKAGIPIRHNIHSIGGHTCYIKDLAFTPDGKSFVTAGADHTARLWDLEGGRSLMVYRGHSAELQSIAVSPDGRNLVTGSLDGMVKIWDLETGICQWTLDAHSGVVRSVVFSNDGAFLYSGGADGLIKQWSITSRTLVWEYTGHTKAICDMEILADGEQLLSASEDGTVCRWMLANKVCVHVYQGLSQACHSLCIHPIKSCFYVGGDDGMIGEFDLLTGECRRRFTGHTMTVDFCFLSRSDCQTLESGKRRVQLYACRTALEYQSGGVLSRRNADCLLL